ncbi:MAG: hypothetical protein IIY77_06545, partial [Lachnospiraceae bacterium]|nr:hypothetical protein [Lachnospiraceae bacterium]
MKKLLAVFLAALLCASALLACGGGGDTTTKAPETQESTKAPDASEGTTAAPETKESESETEKGGDVTELPRKETLYFGGLQWGTVNAWNPIGANQNNFAIAANAAGSRT